MHRRHRVAVLFVKLDWGSGRMTWRPAPLAINDKIYRKPHKITLRRLTNKDSQRALLLGNSIEAY